MEQVTLVTIFVAIIAALPGIYAVYNQRKKNHSSEAHELIDQLQEERNELKKERIELKAEIEFLRKELNEERLRQR